MLPLVVSPQSCATIVRVVTLNIRDVPEGAIEDGNRTRAKTKIDYIKQETIADE